MTHEVREQGLMAGRRRVVRLMRENGLKARQPLRFQRTTDSRHAFPVATNRLDHDFAAAAPIEKWCTNLSYILTVEGRLYLAVVIDLYARRVVGWAVGDRLSKELSLTALRRALVMRRPAGGSLRHSDPSSQYCSNECPAEIRQNSIVISMPSKGNCCAKSTVKTFFKILMSKLLWRTVFQARTVATEALVRCIDGSYNPRWRHSTLGFVSPIQLEKESAN